MFVRDHILNAVLALLKKQVLECRTKHICRW